MKKLFFTFIMISTYTFALNYKDVKDIENKHGVLEALSYYKALAKNGDTKSIFRIVQIYMKGIQIQRSTSEAKKWLEYGKKLKDNQSIYYLGKIYLSKKLGYYDLNKAYNNFAIAANADYAPAQNVIGEFFATGIAVEKDYRKAVFYFEKASKQGFSDAHCNLAFMYANGRGVFQNLGRAHSFAKEGIKQGNKKCQKVWDDFSLAKYPEDKGWKFNFYTEPKP
jgi:uncharacterized protein